MKKGVMKEDIALKSCALTWKQRWKKLWVALSDQHKFKMR